MYVMTVHGRIKIALGTKAMASVKPGTVSCTK
jgi:hypothetical protein